MFKSRSITFLASKNMFLTVLKNAYNVILMLVNNAILNYLSSRIHDHILINEELLQMGCLICLIKYFHFKNIPISQYCPVKPETHEQVAFPNTTQQLPPFKQWLVAQPIGITINFIQIYYITLIDSYSFFELNFLLKVKGFFKTIFD